MVQSLKVALVQQLDGQDPGDVIAAASTGGAEIIVFPEMYSNGYARFEPKDLEAEKTWRSGAVSADGPYVERFRAAARDNNVYVVATFLEAATPDPFNAASLIDPTGETILHHRKVHICDFDSPESACGRGSGFDAVSVETKAGPVTIGLMICMDREYPEAAGALSSKGAEIVLVPNCCDLASDALVGDVRIAQARGRAFEAVIGMGVANYPAPKCDGHSFAVDASGRMIAATDANPCILMAEFDIDAIRSIRQDESFRWRR